MGVTSLLLSVWRPAPDTPADAAATSANGTQCDKPPPLPIESRISQDSSIASLDDRDVAVAAAASTAPSSLPVPGVGVGVGAADAASDPVAASAACPTPAAPRHRCRRVTFALSKKLYRWLEAMAVRHNYGSVHKSVRDLLEWARTGDDADMEWLFGTAHALPSVLCEGWETGAPGTNGAGAPTPPTTTTSAAWTSAQRGAAALDGAADADDARAVTEDEDGPVPEDADCIAKGCKAAAACASPMGPVVLDAFLGESAFLWVTGCARRFSLHGPSAVLDTVIRAVVELGAADDVFESDECGRDLPVSTAELYRDLGIFGVKPMVHVATSAASSPVASPR